MAERRIIMNNKVENFEWHSLLHLSGKGLHKFNAVGKDMTCSQLMNNNSSFSHMLSPFYIGFIRKSRDILFFLIVKKPRKNGVIYNYYENY